MRARWTENLERNALPIVGQTVVASFWPGKYYLVATIQLDSSSPISRLTKTLRNGMSHDETPLDPAFVTDVVKCDKLGFAKSFENPLYEREYSDLESARIGHSEIVNLLAIGQLKV